jgi:hypothetical protein
VSFWEGCIYAHRPTSPPVARLCPLQHLRTMAWARTPELGAIGSAPPGWPVRGALRTDACSSAGDFTGMVNPRGLLARKLDGSCGFDATVAAQGGHDRVQRNAVLPICCFGGERKRSAGSPGASGAPLDCVLCICAFSRRPTVPSRIPLTPVRTLLTGNRHSYPPCVGAGLANRLRLAFAAGRHHVDPPAHSTVWLR